MRPQSRGGMGKREGGRPPLSAAVRHPLWPPPTYTISFFVCPGRRRLYRTGTDEQQHEERAEARETRTAAVTANYTCPQPVPSQAHHSPP